jgi:RNA polymerase sigma factor (TIGR02999 family)
LFAILYAELRRLAVQKMRSERANHTLQPTALVHEAFVKLVQSQGATYNDRAHFFAVAATAMRQILSDHARARRAAKRGGDARQERDSAVWERVSVEASGPGGSAGEIDLLALDDALSELARNDQRRYRVVELRFFGGLEVDDVARLLGVSKSTVEGDWRAARAWLAVKMKG